MKIKLLSIITPVFNDLENLKKTFKSIHEAHKDTEHIIIDGNSNDGSFEFSKMLETKGIARVFSQKSPTFYGAFNEGLEQARGKHVIFLYCGDKLKIEKTLMLIKENSNFDIIAASCSQELDHKKLIYLRSERPEIDINTTSILHSSLIIKPASYNSVNFFDETLKVSADLDCVIKIIKTGAKVTYKDEIICHMEKYGVSNKKYFRKIIDHSIIKYRHVGFLSSLIYLPKRIFKDFILLPFWLYLKNIFSLEK